VPVVLIHQGAGLTKESYEEIGRRLTGGKSPLDSPGDWPVAGLLVHAAGEAEGGFRVVDVWESEEAVRQFGEKLAPLLAELGVEAEPEIYPSHAFVSA
jgi:hypothetical protein